MFNRLREYTAFFNKQYRDEPDGSFLYQLQQAFLKKLLELRQGSDLPDHIFYADDCFVVYRNLGFLNDQDFQGALKKSNVDNVIMGRVWRLWVLAWSMSMRWNTEGVILDCGTYNGCALQVALNYCISVQGRREGKVYACDLFDAPPEESRKVEHGPLLHEVVARRLNDCGNVTVVKGPLPDSLKEFPIEKVTWAQIDLNSDVADASVFSHVLGRLADGAIVIFDDYGFSRYSSTQKALDLIVKNSGSRILELPTGQGMYIHRDETVTRKDKEKDSSSEVAQLRKVIADLSIENQAYRTLLSSRL